MSHFLYALLVKKKARAFFLLKEWILHVKKTRPSLFLSERIISVRKFYPFLINFTNGKDFLTEKVLESFRMRINARKCPINWNWLEKMPNFSVCVLIASECQHHLVSGITLGSSGVEKAILEHLKAGLMIELPFLVSISILFSFQVILLVVFTPVPLKFSDPFCN